jgi:hypothetical protein
MVPVVLINCTSVAALAEILLLKHKVSNRLKIAEHIA